MFSTLSVSISCHTRGCNNLQSVYLISTHSASQKRDLSIIFQVFRTLPLVIITSNLFPLRSYLLEHHRFTLRQHLAWHLPYFSQFMLLERDLHTTLLLLWHLPSPSVNWLPSSKYWFNLQPRGSWSLSQGSHNICTLEETDSLLKALNYLFVEGVYFLPPRRKKMK